MAPRKSQFAHATDCFKYMTVLADSRRKYCSVFDKGYYGNSQEEGCLNCPFYKPKHQFLKEIEKYGV